MRTIRFLFAPAASLPLPPSEEERSIVRKQGADRRRADGFGPGRNAAADARKQIQGNQKAACGVSLVSIDDDAEPRLRPDCLPLDTASSFYFSAKRNPPGLKLLRSARSLHGQKLVSKIRGVVQEVERTGDQM